MRYAETLGFSIGTQMKQFLAFRLDTANQCLWQGGVSHSTDERILLTPKAFSVLQYLVDHAGSLVTQDELLNAVWPDTYVQPEVLKYQVADIRSALGDNARNPTYIETVPRRGYRFVAPVMEASVAVASLTECRCELVGRDEPLRELDARLKRMLKGQRQIVFITGEPGIGKTALADEFQLRAASQVKDIRIARGQCIEGYGGREPYYAVLTAITQLCSGFGGEFIFRLLVDRAPSWAVQFPALLTHEDRGKLQRELVISSGERMLREISDAIEMMTAEFPLLLVLEDVQWAHPGCVDFISAVARGRAQARLMMIVTKRPLDAESPTQPLRLLRQELVSHDLCCEIALQALTENEVGEYLASRLEVDKPPPGLVEVVYSRSEGNPLFMIAVLEHLRQRGYVRKQNGAWQIDVPQDQVDLGVPENMRELIEARISSLTPAEQSALEAASVMGSPFSSTLSAWAARTSADAFDELCEGLTRRRQIIAPAGISRFPDGTVSPNYNFVHELYREVLYNRQSPGRRAKSHRLIGERLERAFESCPREAAAKLAYHFEACGDVGRAINYLRLIAETALRRHSPQTAMTTFRHALDLCSQLSESERSTNETAILEKLASLYIVSFDMRVLETYRRLRRRAAHYGLLETEVRACIDVAYPLSWISTARALVVIERALQLAARSDDAVFQARVRASCLVRRIWASGWNARDADACSEALGVIRQACDPVVVAWHAVDTNFLLWCSSEYREAHRSATESLAILKGEEENPYPNFIYWLSQFVLPWSLLFLGEWGDALAEIGEGIRIVEKNGGQYRLQTLLLYQAWIFLEAMDFTAVQNICESMLPWVMSRARTPWRRFCNVLAGLANAATGDLEQAMKRFLSVRTEMKRETVIHDWYCRILLQSGLTELWIAKGEFAKARTEGEIFLDVTLATAERTWQARAWETNARIAIAQHDMAQAQSCISNALAAMEGFEVPLASWRVYSTAADIRDLLLDKELASQHRETSRSILLNLSDSLHANEAVRQKFLCAATVRRVLEAPKKFADTLQATT